MSFDFVNGFKVSGVVKNIVREHDVLLYLTWVDCTVTRGGQKYFDPSWGEFDMAVGEAITSVFGGPADRGAYGDYDMGGVSTQPGRQSPFTANERKIFDCYAKVREMRQVSGAPRNELIDSVVREALAEHPDEWLLALELVELSQQKKVTHALDKKIFELLIGEGAERSSELSDLVNKGMKIAAISD